MVADPLADYVVVHEVVVRVADHEVADHTEIVDCPLHNYVVDCVGDGRPNGGRADGGQVDGGRVDAAVGRGDGGQVEAVGG